MSLITAFVTQQLSAQSQVATPYAQSAERKANWQRVVKAAQQRRTKNAEDRYKAQLKDWTPTSVLEARLGYARMVSLTFLRKLLAKGLVERRNRGGKADYVKKDGFDWRWVNGN